MIGNKLFLTGLVFCFGVSCLFADVNVLTNPGFENGTAGWAARNCTISTVTSPVRSGTYSARASNRTAAWQGIQQSILEKVTIGQTYQVSGYVRVSTASAQVKVSIQKTDAGDTSYVNVAVGTANNTGWLYLSGTYTVQANGTLTELWVYFEGPNAGVDLYVDDASVFGSQFTDEASVQVNTAARFQTIEGFGAAGAWYENMLTGHAQRTTLYNLLFRDLGLDIYRVRNTCDQSGGAEYMSRSAEIIAAGRAALGRPLKVLVSCWSPPAYLKSNGQTGGGGTLIGGPSNYAYTELAEWFADSIAAWNNLGVHVDYLSIQNEPDWTADWDTCRYEPSQTSDYAGYAQALEAVYTELASRFGSAMPKMIGPETTGFYGAAGSSPSAYLFALNPSYLYGYAHHLYNIAAGDDPDKYLTAMQAFQSAWGTKPLFQTEYEKAAGSWPDAFNLALLLHNALTVEQVSAYLYWQLFWGGSGGLITLNSTTSYTINSDYYGFKHFSAFIHSGWQRVDASADSPLVRSSAYISPDARSLTVVLLNTSPTTAVTVSPAFPDFTITGGTAYRTTQTENCVSIGSYTGGTLVLPARSVVTLSLTGFVGTQHTLTLSSSAGGSVAAPGEGAFTFSEGTAVSIAAAAEGSYRFVQWVGTAADAGKVADPFAAATTVIVDADYTLQALFEYDLTPPSPQPIWRVAPTATGPTRITMTAASCTDDNPPVEYWFECLTDSAFSSGWQASPAYHVEYLSPACEYVFQVKARDSAAARNETGWSPSASAVTEPPRRDVQILSGFQSGLTHAAPASAARRLLVFTAHAEGTDSSMSLAGLTYGGVPMTKIAEGRQFASVSQSYVYIAAFVLDEAGIAAASGSGFAPVWSTTPAGVGYASAFFDSVHPAASISFIDVKGAEDVTVSSSALYAEKGDIVIAAGTCSEEGDYTAGNEFTKAVELDISSADGIVAWKRSDSPAFQTPGITHSVGYAQALLSFVIQGAPKEPLYGDINGDFTVNLEDLPLFLDAWLTAECEPLDISGDCWIDWFELAELARNWLQ